MEKEKIENAEEIVLKQSRMMVQIVLKQMQTKSYIIHVPHDTCVLVLVTGVSTRYK